MEYLKKVVDATIEKTVPQLVKTIVEHAVYPFQVNNKMEDLESATRNLVTKKNNVMTTIGNNTKRKYSNHNEQISEWLNNVEDIRKEADKIQDNHHKRWWSLWSNYMTSCRASKKLREAKNLCDQISIIKETADLSPPQAPEMPVSLSKSGNLESALHYVKDDVHSIIGFWGMGGVGKTHLLNQINNELSRDPTFDVIIYAICSTECCEEKIQNKIIDKLSLDMNGSMEQKRSTIFNFLRERSFVLLLDNLWCRVDLDTIGIPNRLIVAGGCKRKVVLTTRSTEICEHMEVQKRIRVDVLKWDDAWDLFKEQMTEEILDSDPLIQKFAVEVVKVLGGLPLAIITVGRAMRDKADPSEWKQAVVLLKQACIDDAESLPSNQSVFHTLRFSYDSLKSDSIKQCFLHCALWPENCLIEENYLIELWMGTGLIDEPKIAAAYTVGYTYIRKLQAACLLGTGDDGYTIKMHDVIRDMALWIANNQGIDTGKWVVLAGTYKESRHIEVFPNTEKLSIMNNAASNALISIPCFSTKLSILLLNGNMLQDLMNLKLDLFSELTILDLSNNDLNSFPVEICILVHLQFLNLSWNRNLMSLPEELAALSNLKYLHLIGTKCTFPSFVLSKLKALRVLDLSFSSKDDNSEIFPMLEQDLQCLPDFQSLGITISNKLDFHRLSQTVSVPIRWLQVRNYKECCLSFSSSFLENFQLKSNLLFLHIGSTDGVNCVEFESTSEKENICHLGRLEYLSFFEMWNMKEILWNSLDPKDVFPRLQYLDFDRCPELISISWVVNLLCIRELKVSDCDSIKQLICIDDLTNHGINVTQHFFPFLKKMRLYSNEGLEIISDFIINFPALEVLEVDDCEKLKKLPFKPSKTPRKLKWVSGSEEWWDNIKMEEDSQRSLLQPFFKKLSR